MFIFVLSLYCIVLLSFCLVLLCIVLSFTVFVCLVLFCFALCCLVLSCIIVFLSSVCIALFLICLVLSCCLFVFCLYCLVFDLSCLVLLCFCLVVNVLSCFVLFRLALFWFSLGGVFLLSFFFLLVCHKLVKNWYDNKTWKQTINYCILCDIFSEAVIKTVYIIKTFYRQYANKHLFIKHLHANTLTACCHIKITRSIQIVTSCTNIFNDQI
jgi:hypothetical protein